ncbi:hypothetical protein G6F56_006093 [Rhizopus delemar]|uniref:Kinase-regulated stress-responsive transcription factor skn7 n=1 Tax=Rhizopus stolonifer TaxID=4846 RepID=A0A367JMU7_RHIST|nr:hypothetical protein G6F56_006093 [Rhizopus delemar]RCH91280.1 kinase-regulated stress-responsive transcription factor skn7 [Rhizopus stolonifer]
MNYTEIYDNLPETISTHSNEYHPYQLLTDNTRHDMSPLMFHTTPETNSNSLISTHPPSESWNQCQMSLVSPRELSNSQRGVAGFVSKLYQCLQAPDTEQRYARWCTHQGKAMFIIECIPEFTQTVLPRLFKHCKFQSFVRQLNIYGFQRDTDARKSKDSKDKESCRWFHSYFRPDRRDMLPMIRRKATKMTRRRQVKVEDSETILKMEGEEDSADDDTDQRRSSSSASSVHGLDYASPYEQSNPLLHVTMPEPQLSNEFEFMGAESDNEREKPKDVALQLYEAEQRYEKMETYYQSKIAEQQMRIQALENAIYFQDVKPAYVNSMGPSSYYPPYNMNLPYNNMNNTQSTNSWIPNTSSYTPGSMHNAK